MLTAIFLPPCDTAFEAINSARRLQSVNASLRLYYNGERLALLPFCPPGWYPIGACERGTVSTPKENCHAPVAA